MLKRWSLFEHRGVCITIYFTVLFRRNTIKHSKQYGHYLSIQKSIILIHLLIESGEGSFMQNDLLPGWLILCIKKFEKIWKYYSYNTYLLLLPNHIFKKKKMLTNCYNIIITVINTF